MERNTLLVCSLEELLFFKISALPKSDLQIQINPKITAEIFVGVNRLLLKTMWKGRGTTITKTTLRKKNKVGELNTTWPQDRCAIGKLMDMDQGNRGAHPEKPCSLISLLLHSTICETIKLLGKRVGRNLLWLWGR